MQIFDFVIGMGDFVFEIVVVKECVMVVGVDFLLCMFEVVGEKLGQEGSVVSFEFGDVQNLKYEIDSFDGLMIVFGICNVLDCFVGLCEMVCVIWFG